MAKSLPPLTLVSHHLRHASSRDEPIAVPSSHPLFNPSGPSSSSSYNEHLGHATARLRTALDEEDDEDSADSQLLIARVLQDACTLELSVVPTSASQTTSAPPPRLFVFPAPLLSDVAIFADESYRNLYVVAVTVTGWLYRLRFPLPGGFHSSTLPHNWAVEHRITTISGYTEQEIADLGSKAPTLVHAVEAGLVLIACRDGSMVKLEQRSHAGEYDDTWQETTLRSTSLFSRFFSRGNSTRNTIEEGPNPSSPTHVVSATSHISGDSAALALCVSRDRRLRIWDLVTDACLRTVEIAGSESHVTTQFGISGTTRPLVRPCRSDDPRRALDVLMFVPGPLPTGSRFARYSIQVGSTGGSSSIGDVNLVWGKRCDDDTDGLRAELRDMRVYSTNGQRLLWTLWDAGGRTLVKYTSMGDGDEEEDGTSWQTVAHSTTDSIVYSPLHGPRLDSILAAQDIEPRELFLPRIFEAGRFSSQIIKRALKVYKDGLIASLSNARVAIPAVLETPASAFATTAEHIASVVGCALRVETDPVTGALQVEQYRIELVKEWRKFIGWLDQADSQGRWAMQLVGGQEDDRPVVPVVLSQDRLSIPVQQDSALALLLGEETAQGHNLLTDASSTSVQTLVQLARYILEQSSDSDIADFTAAVANIAREPLTADLLDVAAELWETADFFDDDVTAAVDSTLTHDEVEAGLWQLAAVLSQGSTPHGNEDEDDDEEPLFSTELGIGLLSNGTYQALKARRTIAQALTAVVVYVQSRDDIAPRFERLAELLVRYMHTLSTLDMLAHVSDSTTEVVADASILGSDNEQDSIAGQLQRLNVRGSKTAALQDTQGDNILHTLLLRGVVLHRTPSSGQWLPVTAHAAIGTVFDELFGDQGDGHQLRLLPTKQALIAHRLLTSGFAEAATAIVASYPASSLSHLLLAKALLLEKRDAEAAESFLQVRDFGDATLAFILPSTEAILGRRGTYYRYVAGLFERAENPELVAEFARLALEAADIDEAEDVAKLRDLYLNLFRAELALARFSKCYATITSLPDELDELRRDCIRTLISTMCEGGDAAVAELLSFNFARHQGEVERNLSFKARNSDPTSATPNYYTILYSYHVSRGDYKSAGAVMYQQAHRLSDLHRYHGGQVVTAAAEVYVEIAVQQARSYLAAINALSMLPAGDAWFADAREHGSDGRKSTTTRYIPQEHWQPESNGIRIVQQEDVKREYALVLARLELVQLYPELATASTTLGANDAVSLFIRNEHYDRAFATARATGADQSGVFSALALECAGIEYVQACKAQDGSEADEVGDDEVLEWSFLNSCDRTSSWIGTPAEKAWRYLRLNLEIADSQGPETKWKHRVVTLDRLLSLSPSDDAHGKVSIPSWLTTWFLERQPDLLVRSYLRNGLIDDALETCIAWLNRATKQFKTAAALSQKQQQWIPYSLIDVVLKTAVDPDLRPARGSKSASQTRTLADEVRKACVQVRFGEMEGVWKRERGWSERQQHAGGDMDWA